MEFTDNQKKVLGLLLDKYEGSKTYQGTNLLQQRFSIEPEKVWKEYTSDYADVFQVEDFENELKLLQKENLVELSKKDGVISKITACEEKWNLYYEILQRQSKHEVMQEETLFYENWI